MTITQDFWDRWDADDDGRMGDPTGSEVKLLDGTVVEIDSAEYDPPDWDVGINCGVWNVTFKERPEMDAQIWDVDDRTRSVHDYEGNKIGELI